MDQQTPPSQPGENIDNKENSENPVSSPSVPSSPSPETPSVPTPNDTPVPPSIDPSVPTSSTPLVPPTDTTNLNSDNSNGVSVPPPQVPSSPPPQQHHKKNFWMIAIIILLVIFVGGLLAAGWYFQSQLKQTHTEKQAAAAVSPMPKKELVIGTDPTFQPMEYIDKGKYIGYDIDLANLLGKELGEKITFKNIVFDDLFTSLKQNKIDMVISGITITDERKKDYDFSEPYLNVGQVIITKNTTSTIKTTADLKGKKIAVQQGTTNEQSALKFTSPNLVIRYPDFVQATKALVDGQVDAIFSDLSGAKGIVTKNPTLKIASDPFTNEYYGIVFKKGNPEVKQINKALDSIRIKGILTDLKQKWLD